MKISFLIKKQIIDLEFSDSLTVKRLKEELKKLYHLQDQIIMKVVTKQLLLDDSKKFNDYLITTGDLIEIKEGRND